MLGKRALFPHGFHVTGMPIKVCFIRVSLDSTHSNMKWEIGCSG
jgi:leucyl-tRNA synthetase